MDGFNWGLPENIAEHGAKVDAMMSVIHWFMLALFVFWGIFMAVALWKFRARPGHRATYEPIHATWSKWLEVGVAVFEAVLLVGFSMPVWAKFKSEFPSAAESTQVNIVAQQFAWNFHYPGRDGVFGKRSPKFVDNANPVGIDPSDEHGKDDVVAVNQFHFPVEKPVIAKLTSNDVIHSFGVNTLRLKQDAIPGMDVSIWFKATKTGTYDIACSQLCGISHFRMKANLIPESQADFDAWMKEQIGEEEPAEVAPAPTEGLPPGATPGAPPDAAHAAQGGETAPAASPAPAHQ